MQTVPSILEKNSQDLFFQIDRLSKYFSRFQIDIADGIFVPNKTVQIEDIVDCFSSYSLFPIPYSLTFDFHLMVKDYEKEIEKLEKLRNFIKINLILIHYSVFPKPYPLNPNPYSFPIGLTLNPRDQVDDLTSHYNLKQIPSIQIMSVVPGLQGNPFLPETLKKIEQLSVLGYRNKIFLDGAVNDKTLPIINKLKYKPDVICPGSYLTKAKDLKKNVEYLNKLT